MSNDDGRKPQTGHLIRKPDGTIANWKGCMVFASPTEAINYISPHRTVDISDWWRQARREGWTVERVSL